MQRLHYTRLFAVLALLLSTAAANAQSAPQGRYECWYFTSPRPLYNFALQTGGRYVDSEGNAGTIAVSGGRMQFRGGNLDGLVGVYKGGNPPTVSFINERGEERFLCQLVR
jgi:hypothetical protein